MATTIVPFPAPSSTRRAVLGRGLAAGVAAAAVCVTHTLAGETDPHGAWLNEWRALLAWCNAPDTHPGRNLEDVPEWYRLLELEELIAATPARTMAGALAQLRFTLDALDEYREIRAEDAPALQSAVATLDRLAREGAHA